MISPIFKGATEPQMLMATSIEMNLANGGHTSDTGSTSKKKKKRFQTGGGIKIHHFQDLRKEHAEVVR